MSTLRLVILFLMFPAAVRAEDRPKAEDVLAGLKSFWEKTARPDGSFMPGADPNNQINVFSTPPEFREDNNVLILSVIHF